MPDLSALQDPRTMYATPPMAEQRQEPPGDEGAMIPKPDHGEESYIGHGRLAGRAALVTGGDSGIGKAVAIAYAREGADVLISYLGDQEEADAEATVRLVRAAGRKGVAVRGDIADPAHCLALVDRTVAEFGHIDILVNNAGWQRVRDSFMDIAPGELEYTFKTNVFAQIYLAQNALIQMKPGSAIINTTSIQGYEPDSYLMAYAATKAAVSNLTKSMSKEAIKYGVRVNAVAPGPVWTPIVVTTMPESEITPFGHDVTMGRGAQPVELSPVYVLLASSEASFITGQIYGITGGKFIG